jgi:glucose-6-phosphate-specific signal transduction histidine kinase
MNTHATAALSERVMLWAPRLLALAVSLSAGVFALDTFGSETPFLQALPDFLIHLVPVAIVVAVVALAWHREWIGAVIFTILAAAYAVAARERPSWIAVISGPLLITAAVYWWSWIHRRA